MSTTNFEHDKGYAWIVLLMTILLNAVEASVFTSPGVYFLAWSEAFTASKAQLGLAGSLLGGISGFTGVFVGLLVDKYGCRLPVFTGTLLCAGGFISSTFAPSIEWLYLLYGVIAGIGLGTLGLPPLICVQLYFKKRRAFALGISMVGHSVGALTSAPLIQLGIDFYGWRGAMLLHAGAILQVLVFGSFLRRVPITQNEGNNSVSTNNEAKYDQRKHIGSSTENKDSEKELAAHEIKHSDTQIQSSSSTYISNKPTESINRNPSKLLKLWNFKLLKLPSFAFYILIVCVVEFAVGLYVKFIPIKAREDGLSNQHSALLISAISCASMTMRVTVSLLLNFKWVKRAVLCSCTAMGIGVACMAASYAYNYTTYLVTSACFGLFMGSYFSTAFTVMTDIVGVQNIAHGFSILNFFTSIALLTSLPLAGLIIDVSGSQDLPFIIYGAVTCVCGLAFLAILHHKGSPGTSNVK